MNILRKLFKKSDIDLNLNQRQAHINASEIKESKKQELGEINKPDIPKTEIESPKPSQDLITLLAKKDLGLQNFVEQDVDSLLNDAARLVVQSQMGSTSLIQRRMKIGFNRAGRLMDQLEAAGIVGPNKGDKSREVLFRTEKELEEYLKMIFDSNNYLSQSRFYQDNKDEIERRKVEILKEIKAEQERAKEEKIASEKEKIRQDFLEKERKKKLEKEVLKELIDEGLIFNQINSLGREPIPQEVMDKVWNRDGGRCVLCQGNKNLEFDHIIPVSKGGASTYRNLQILCKTCNVKKSNKIG